jgi:hypothetical protein
MGGWRSKAGSVWPFLAILGLTFGQPVRAEDRGFQPGFSRIRVTAPGTLAKSTSGTYLSLDSDSLWFRSDAGESVSVAVGSVTGLERSVGTQGHTLEGILGGVALGAVIGGAIGSEVTEGQSKETGADLTAFAYFLGGAACGLVIGAVVGGAIRTERWETLPPTSWRLGLDIHRSTQRLRIAVRFQ